MKKNAMIKLGLTVVVATALVGCFPEDDNDDPNNDSAWTISTGVYTSPLNATYTEVGSCVAVDLDANPVTLESRDVAWKFTDSYPASINVGGFMHRFYVGNSTCDVGTLGFTDVVEVEYTESSASFDFNRFDFTVTDTVRKIDNQDGVDLLNNNGSCSPGGAWDLQSVNMLSNAVSACADFSHNNGPNVYATQSRWQGVYQYHYQADGTMTYGIYWDAEGQRPSGDSTYTSNYE